jgi:hypothetical protein
MRCARSDPCGNAAPDYQVAPMPARAMDLIGAKVARALEVAEESAVRLAVNMGRDVIRRFSASPDAMLMVQRR